MQVLVRDNNVDQALKVLKKKMQREGIFREMKLRGHYEKPSVKSPGEGGSDPPRPQARPQKVAARGPAADEAPGDPGSGTRKRRPRPPLAAPLLIADAFPRPKVDIFARYPNPPAVRNGLPAAAPFPQPSASSDMLQIDNLGLQRLGPPILRFRERHVPARGQGRSGRTQRRRQIDAVQADPGRPHPGRRRDRAAESRQDRIGRPGASGHAGHPSGHDSGRRRRSGKR